ncbi:DUF2510 domain-containing protein [Microbacterium sp. 18062]|uniref:DUF2510 domain-containing protein n=1 Tax=Microbacterium sp. 18062 TaxID=2681410 RepID=UPI001359E382|nr:DUF2510 domain-containing protein [Microbacterium sp. 18062]
MTNPSSPPGWYDAGVPGQLRWWDGAKWTEHVHPMPSVRGSSLPSAQPMPMPAGGDKGTRARIAGWVALVPIPWGLVFAAAAFLSGNVGFLLIDLAAVAGLAAISIVCFVWAARERGRQCGPANPPSAQSPVVRPVSGREGMR